MDEWMSADLKAECAEILKKSMLDSDTDECESHEEDWEKGFNERARWLHSEVCVIQEIDKTASISASACQSPSDIFQSGVCLI
mmetsp:Transcript_43170/g.107397  ORF Transcript_43170/g.107397 Transcript_43170/m.107397 type:complete len:83 (-) Transcript_43170:1473-1721(-)